VDVALDPETEKLVQAELKAGRFQDATALIGTALKHFLIAREFGEEYTPEEIEAKIARGLSQLERGEGVNGSEFFEKLRLRGEQLRRER
jgi:predicted transcriptional regulator